MPWVLFTDDHTYFPRRGVMQTASAGDLLNVTRGRAADAVDTHVGRIVARPRDGLECWQGKQRKPTPYRRPTWRQRGVAHVSVK